MQRADEAYAVARGISAAGQIFGFAAAVAGRPRRVVSARCEYEEALFWVSTRGYGVPLIANVMPAVHRQIRHSSSRPPHF